MTAKTICAGSTATPRTHLRDALVIGERIKALLDDPSAPAGRREQVSELIASSSIALHHELDAFDDDIAEGRICAEQSDTKLIRATLAVIAERSAEAVKHVSQRATFRKARRNRYDHRFIIRGLMAAAAQSRGEPPEQQGLNVLTVMSVLYDDLVAESMKDKKLDADSRFAAYGAERVDLAYAQSLAAVVAHHRGLEPWRWSQYKLGTHDSTVIKQLGQNPDLHHRLGHMHAEWLGADASTRRFALEKLGWFQSGSPQGETALVLISEWDGELHDLVEVAQNL
jgi:hypothetical protein